MLPLIPAPYSSLLYEKVFLSHFRLFPNHIPGALTFLLVPSNFYFLIGGFEAAKINWKIIACKNIQYLVNEYV